MKYIKIVIYTIQIALPALFLLAFILEGKPALSESYLWISYLVIITLSLPSLISKVILKDTLLGFSTVISFIYYLVAFTIAFFLNLILKVDLSILLTLFTLFSIALWNILFFVFVKNEKQKYLFWISDKTITSVVTSIAVLLVIFILFRQIDSVVATDYLQHQAVVNNMTLGEILCFLPSECSNLFLQDGYTTFFHTIWSSLSFHTVNNLTKVFFIIDLIWPILLGLVTFKYAARIFKNDLVASLSVAIATLTFANWAYEFNFLIPQTFAFFLFLNLITLKDLEARKLIIGCLVLVLSHFVIGTFLTGILIIKFVIIKNWRNAYDKTRRMNFIVYISFLFVLLSLLLNIAGFSIEKAIQQREIDYIGATTNEAFPKNIELILAPLGFLTVVLIISVGYYFIKKAKKQEVFFSIIYICINLSVFLLAPTYAGKFMIGFGIFSSIIIVNYFRDIKFDPKFQLGMIFLLIIGLIGTFGLNFKDYLRFYSREHSLVSALTPEDKGITDYLNTNNLNCIIIADPYTQVVIAGLTKYQTAAGQYMSLESRGAIMTFINESTVANYSRLNELKEISHQDFCFIYTARLEESLYENRIMWTKNVYSLPIRNDYGVLRNEGLNHFMEINNHQVLYQDNSYILFSK